MSAASHSNGAGDIVLASGFRTPFGDFGGSLSAIPLTTLGIHAARASIADAGIDPEVIDHLVFGNVFPVEGDGIFASRVIALKCGLPESSSALNVSRACGSGLQAIVSAGQQIASGHSELALAGGGENFSRAPYVSTESRWGVKRGPTTLEDSLEWVYRCPFSGEFMGETGENLAEDFGYEREAMDDWGFMSQQRAGDAIDSGFLSKQIAAIEVPDGKGSRLFEIDEFPRPHVTRDKLSRLRPVFREGGCVTAGNASGVTDGAAFIIVADRNRADDIGLKAQFSIIDWMTVGVAPRIMGAGVVPAISKLLERCRMRVSDIDYFEINEAFAVVNLHAENKLGISREMTNLYGGGISIGHPPGATGVRMTITAMHHLCASGGRYAVISMCLGAGQGMAMLIENLECR